MIYVKMRL